MSAEHAVLVVWIAYRRRADELVCGILFASRNKLLMQLAGDALATDQVSALPRKLLDRTNHAVPSERGSDD